MNVKLFKLINGQEIVAEVVNEADDAITIRRPLAVHVLRDPQGNPTLGFGEWSVIMVQDQPIKLYLHSIMTQPLTLLSEVAQSYEQQMSSIILPPQPTSQILMG